MGHFNKPRCQSRYFIWKSYNEVEKVQCSEAAEHRGAHIGRLKSGLFHMWTDAEGEFSKTKRPKQEIYKRVGAIKAWRAWGLLATWDDGAHIGAYHTPIYNTPAYWREGKSRPPGNIDVTYTLKSTARGYVWMSPRATTMDDKQVWFELEDIFRFGKHEDRDPGIFCYKTPDYVLRYFPSQPVYGHIDLTGHVVEHDLGYRAQRAMIRELWIIPQQGNLPGPVSKPIKEVAGDIRTQFEKRYDCEVHILRAEQLAAWARYYTTVVMEEMEQDERDRKANS